MNKSCEKCGSPLEMGDEFCSKCGNKVVSQNITEQNNASPTSMKTNNNKIILIVILVVILIAGGVTGFLIKKNYDKKEAEKQEQIEQEKADKAKLESDISLYNLTANLFSTRSIELGANMEKLGNEIQTYWSNYIYKSKYKSIDDAVEKAQEDNADLVQSIKEDKEIIDNYYKQLLNVPDESNSRLMEIKDAVKELYSELIDFYQLVIYPSGSYVTFTSDFSRLDNSIVKKWNQLSALLD